MTKVKVTVEGQRFVTYKSSVSHNSKNNKQTLIKLHRKIKQNEKVCHAQNLVSNDQGQGHNQIKDWSFTNCMSAITQKPIKKVIKRINQTSQNDKAK